jgi:uncharacterized protein
MHMEGLSIRALRAQDEAAAETLFADVIGGRLQARLGEAHDVVSLPGVAAWVAEELVGLATYRIDGARAELAAFAVADGCRHGGTGTAVLDALCTTLVAHGVREVWLVTTNDNVDALRFYQRRGFVLAELHSAGVDESRRLKPSIPRVGSYDIPMRDELVLVRSLDSLIDRKDAGARTTTRKDGFMAMSEESRTRIRRLPELQRTDRAELHAILDEGRVMHVALIDDDHPFCLPMAYARDGDRLLLHGSTGSRLMRLLAEGQPMCASVTVLDGIVVARSAFESSMQYRSVVILGQASPVDDPLDGLRRLTDGLIPGRWAEVRPPSKKELAATMVLELPLDEWSVKVSDGGPEDAPEDVASDAWAGTVSISTVLGDPRPAADLRRDVAVPRSVERLCALGV